MRGHRGLVDVQDIAGFLLNDVAKEEADLNVIMFTGLPSLNHPISNAISTDSSLVATAATHSQTRTHVHTDFSLLDRPVPIRESDSLLNVIRTMCNPKVLPS
jgi:hypothetical protein